MLISKLPSGMPITGPKVWWDFDDAHCDEGRLRLYTGNDFNHGDPLALCACPAMDKMLQMLEYGDYAMLEGIAFCSDGLYEYIEKIQHWDKERILATQMFGHSLYSLGAEAEGILTPMYSMRD